MRCKKIEKWVSDGMDGRLSEKKRKTLEAHAAKCASCCAYKRQLEKIQAEAKSLSVPALSPQFWQDSISKLKAGLESSEQKEFKFRSRQSPAFFSGRRWAWAGAASVFVLAAGLYFFLSGNRIPIETFPLTFEDSVKDIYENIGDNSGLEAEFNSVLQASINEHAMKSDVEVRHLLYGNSFFLESLSDEEVQLLDMAVKNELKL